MQPHGDGTLRIGSAEDDGDLVAQHRAAAKDHEARLHIPRQGNDRARDDLEAMAAAAERRLRLLQGQAVDRRHDGPAHLGDQHGRQEQRMLAELDTHQRHRLGRDPSLGRLGIRWPGQAADRRMIEPADMDGHAAFDRQADGPRPGLRQRKARSRSRDWRRSPRRRWARAHRPPPASPAPGPRPAG